MISDTERRDVARRLRSVAREVDRGGFSETIKHVKLAVFEDADRYRPNGTLDRLADLIEPRCDRDALLELADEMQGYADGAASGDGFPYVNAGSLWSYADRIREALGVES